MTPPPSPSPSSYSSSASSPSPADLVITGCTALRPRRARADRLRRGRRDRRTGGGDRGDRRRRRAAPVATVERIDARGQVAMPGLINCHTHAPMVALRGLAEDLPAEEWFNDVIWPVESNLTGEGRGVGRPAGLRRDDPRRGDLLRRPLLLDGHGRRRGRGDAGCARTSARPSSPRRGPKAARSPWSSRYGTGARAGGRITTALAPHAPYTVDDADLAATAELAREHGLPVHLHASENRDQTDNSLARHGVTPIEVLERTGLLGVDADVLIAHGTGIVERDLPVLERAAGPVGRRHRAARLPQVRLAHDPGARPAPTSASPSGSPRTGPPPTTPSTCGRPWPSPRSSRSPPRATRAG